MTLAFGLGFGPGAAGMGGNGLLGGGLGGGPELGLGFFGGMVG